mmetsp:Transcript_12675/g.40544  ORF Transcript_12675/g.40544 Transcript_12675/m.40544 type:complete len:332 (-) Transcript_12675:162-1157(-)
MLARFVLHLVLCLALQLILQFVLDLVLQVALHPVLKLHLILELALDFVLELALHLRLQVTLQILLDLVLQSVIKLLLHLVLQCITEFLLHFILNKAGHCALVLPGGLLLDLNLHAPLGHPVDLPLEAARQPSREACTLLDLPLDPEGGTVAPCATLRPSPPGGLLRSLRRDLGWPRLSSLLVAANSFALDTRVRHPQRLSARGKDWLRGLVVAVQLDLHGGQADGEGPAAPLAGCVRAAGPRPAARATRLGALAGRRPPGGRAAAHGRIPIAWSRTSTTIWAFLRGLRRRSWRGRLFLRIGHVTLWSSRYGVLRTEGRHGRRLHSCRVNSE